MTREEKIQAIYKEIANKDIDEWCIIEADWERGIILDYSWIKAYVWWRRWDFEKFDDYQHLSIKFWYQVIWRPVMIWDVIYYIRKKYWNNHSWFHSYRSKLIDLRSEERESIEWQYDECIDYVYSLIPKS